MQPNQGPIPEVPSYPQVDLADPLEMARWSWLLDAADEHIRYAVGMVGNNGDAVAHYIEMFGRPAGMH